VCERNRKRASVQLREGGRKGRMNSGRKEIILLSEIMNWNKCEGIQSEQT